MGEPQGRLWERVAGRTRRLLADGLRALGPPLSDAFYEQLEQLLLAADLGPGPATRLAAGVRAKGPRSRAEAVAALEAELAAAMSSAPRRLNLDADPACILLFGVNGSGKTTTAGKLAHRLRLAGRRPLLVGADTYRAAAIEQARLWAERAEVPFLAGREGGDPAAAVFDALQSAAARGRDVVVVDTAGRLHTQANLLQELAKVARVAARAQPGAPHESLLVLDAVLGQSSLSQAQRFHQAVPLSGLVLAKLDGSARGGAVVAIEEALRAPVKLAGVGEDVEDLVAFDPTAFARSLLEDGSAPD